FSSRRRHTRFSRDWSSDVCSSDLRFRFYSTVLNGVPEQQERWERAVSRVGALNGLGEALGQLYVERYFPASSKRQMEELVENLRSEERRVGKEGRSGWEEGG